MGKKKTHDDLSREELDDQNGEELPEREAMSVIDLGGESTPSPVSGIEPPQKGLPIEPSV